MTPVVTTYVSRLHTHTHISTVRRPSELWSLLCTCMIHHVSDILISCCFHKITGLFEPGCGQCVCVCIGVCGVCPQANSTVYHRCGSITSFYESWFWGADTLSPVRSHHSFADTSWCFTFVSEPPQDLIGPHGARPEFRWLPNVLLQFSLRSLSKILLKIQIRCNFFFLY